MQMYKYIVIDDEPLAREIIINFAANVDWLELAGEFGSASAAMDAVNSCDIVFIDINMPKISGLDFIKSLKNPPLFVFTTAYREFAVEAFELNAVDYLVKPFSFDRFLQSTNKLYLQLQTNSQPDSSQSRDFILVKTDTRYVKIEIPTIKYIEAYREYVKIHTTEKVVLSLISMKKLQEMLPADLFFRIHRSYIISIKHLDIIQGFEAKLGDATLPISRDLRDELLLFLQNN